MIITCWILLVMFGILNLYYWKCFFTPKVSIGGFATIIWIFSMFIVAIIAGILFGGLKIFGIGV